MENRKHMSLVVLVYVLCVLASLKFGCGSITGGNSNRSCLESEKQALLIFKESLVDHSNYLSSWVGDDCCTWRGIGCNNTTGHLTRLDLRNGNLTVDKILNSSLIDLKYLNYLDLSFNSFDGIQIPEFLGSFKDLTHLDLSHCGFEGLVPHHLGNLSSLQYLDLGPAFDYDISIDSLEWLSKLSLLEHLDLSVVNLSSAVDGFSAINMLPNSLLVLKLSDCYLPNNHLPFVNLTSLVSLDLSRNQLNSSFPLWILNNTGLAHLSLGGNDFSGAIPKSIGSLTSLSTLDLAANKFNDSIPHEMGNLTELQNLDIYSTELSGSLPETFCQLSKLERLDMSKNQFMSGSIPKCIGRLTSLSTLDLSSNEFQGLIPHSIGNLTSLSTLDLSSNKFQGPIPNSIGSLTSLSRLDLSENKLNDSIPHEMGNLTELTYLDMGLNELRGRLPESFCHLSKLEYLYASANQLSGSIPKCIGELSNLISLVLLSNSWEGFLSEYHFVNLTSLTELYISSKSNLVMNVSSEWVPTFQLQKIYLESIKVGPKFPQWLLTQTQIDVIILSNTSISDTIPVDWFVSVLSQASDIDLSNNDINVEQLSFISAAPNDLSSLKLSNNRFSGEFPAFICNLTNMYTLVLSNNNFSGELPQCLGNLTYLNNLDVMNNSLSGDIPVSLGSLTSLVYLNLHNNKFQGKLPLSFQNLTELVALDVGNNYLRDILPAWTGDQLPRLLYLILRSNNFYGNIPAQLCNLSSIQILNFAQNQITGNIPPCFGNFSAMITGGNRYLYSGFGSIESHPIIDDAKGYEQEYTTTLGFMYTIDLSNNNISGEIPEELMNLHGLVNLNLTGNHLVGKIPDTIGKLENLQFLDLSRNELYGPVPQSLSDLNFLTRLNLSFNNLSGRIPTGNQLQTLDDASIYAGNNQLCGRPILKPCVGDAESHNVRDHNEADSDSDDDHLWIYAGIGPGMLVGFLGFCGSLYFFESWRYVYFSFIEQEIVVLIAVKAARLRRNFHT